MTYTPNALASKIFDDDNNINWESLDIDHIILSSLNTDNINWKFLNIDEQHQLSIRPCKYWWSIIFICVKESNELLKDKYGEYYLIKPLILGYKIRENKPFNGICTLKRFEKNIKYIKIYYKRYGRVMKIPETNFCELEIEKCFKQSNWMFIYRSKNKGIYRDFD